MSDRSPTGQGARMRRAGIAPLVTFAAVGLFTLTIAMAGAQSQSKANVDVSIPTPPQPGAIPLYPGQSGAKDTEQWDSFIKHRIVRNVTRPTLTPFLPARIGATGAAVIVAPGGGLKLLNMDGEGYEVASWLARHGVAAFVLKYRVCKTPSDFGSFAKAAAGKSAECNSGTEAVGALKDAETAVRLVRARAKEWGVDPHRVGFVGFSAGAMLAERVALVRDSSVRPDFVAPIYGPLQALQVPAYAPPMFVAVALDDPVMARAKALGLILSWWKAGRPVEAHLYEEGGHGFAMGQVTAATSLWPDELYAWMKDNHFLQAASGTDRGGHAAYSTETPLAVLLDDPQAKAVLGRRIPTVMNNKYINMATGMSLRQLAQYSPQKLTPKVLSDIDADLARLGPRSQIQH